MELEIEDGKGLVKIIISEHCNYLKFQKPVSIVWHDGYGSIGKFLSILPYNEQYRNEIAGRINNNIYENYTNREIEAYNLLKPLFGVFESGKYLVKFYSSGKYFEYEQSNNEISRYEDWKLEISGSSKIEKSKKLYYEYVAFFIKNSITKKYGDTNCLDYTTHNYYDGNYLALIATQPIDSISNERVKFFLDEIERGKRPFVILFRRYVEANDDYSSDFVIDGHHKLIAYKKLNVSPPILSIEQITNKAESLEFILQDLKNHLYPWQYRHLSLL